MGRVKPSSGLRPVGKQGALGSRFGHFIYLVGRHRYLAGHSIDLGGHLYLAGHHRYLVDKCTLCCSLSVRCWGSPVSTVQPAGFQAGSTATAISFIQQHGNYKAGRLPAQFSSGGSGQTAEVKASALQSRRAPSLPRRCSVAISPRRQAARRGSGPAPCPAPPAAGSAAPPPARPGPHGLGERRRRGARPSSR